MTETTDFCRNSCFNIKGYDGSCCTVEGRNWIMGAIPDHEEVFENIKKMYPNLDLTWDDCFITYEEGSRLFPDKPTWTNPNNYPAMRINLNSHRKGCVFYNDVVGFCQIYEARSQTCSNFKCDALIEYEEQQYRISKGLELLEKEEQKSKKNKQKEDSIQSTTESNVKKD